uniref:Uncharacterized protein n=1 Tax=Siphoviridae sp. ctcUB23 TaxID=2825573 RepID=A0A8S5PIR0_9CAUD|nr:MAG TPA: hypothetical protein [Siphoviridae sp. ctcUB23]
MGKVGCLKSKIKSEVRVLGCPQPPFLAMNRVQVGRRWRRVLSAETGRRRQSGTGRLTPSDR